MKFVRPSIHSQEDLDNYYSLLTDGLFLYVKEQRSIKKIDRYRGADRDRTDNLLVANQALSQLSYSPAAR